MADEKSPARISHCRFATSCSEMRIIMKRYDVIIVGAGPGGIFSAYELTKKDSDLKIAVFETGTSLGL